MVTKREEVGFAWASVLKSYLQEYPNEQRQEYLKRFIETLEGYEFYSQSERNVKSHPRSVKNRKPSLREYQIGDPESFGIFVAKQLEEGLVAETSEAKRKYLLRHLEDFLN